MSRQPKQRKHIPRRVCVVCQAVRPKRDLARIVRTPEGTVIVDETGKRNGRGAYLCRQRSCWEKALAQQRLERSLKTTLTAECRAELQKYAQGLPLLLAAEAGDHDEAMGRMD